VKTANQSSNFLEGNCWTNWIKWIWITNHGINLQGLGPASLQVIDENFMHLQQFRLYLWLYLWAFVVTRVAWYIYLW